MSAYSISTSYRVMTGEALILSINQGVSIFLSQAAGFCDIELARMYFKRNFIYFWFVVFIYTLLNLINYEILIGVGVPKGIADEAEEFLKLEIVHTILFGLIDLVKSLLIAQKYFKIHVVFDGISFGFYVLLIYYLLKVKELGLLGLALADILNDLFLIVVYAIFCVLKRRKVELFLKGEFFTNRIFKFDKIWEIALKNIEVSSCMLITLISSNMMGILISPFCNETELAAYYGTLSAVLPLIVFGYVVPIALSVYLSKNSGGNNLDQVNMILNFRLPIITYHYFI